MTKETDLYEPVKALLESKGYDVKSEVKGCDVVAVKDGEPTVIVELKLIFSLDLVLQGISRQALSDDVYLAILAPETPRKRKNWRLKQKDYLKLCRKLGLGLMQVTPPSDQPGSVLVLLDPKPYAPRKSKVKQSRLITEFKNRTGDPNKGGVSKTTIMTAYRQNALRCALLLSPEGEMKAAEIRKKAGVSNAASILQKNHYGWFERVSRGVYALTEAGKLSLTENAEAIETFSLSSPTPTDSVPDPLVDHKEDQAAG